MTNAEQAVGDAPLTLRVNSKLDGDYLIVTLSDNGPGIPAQLVERIFDPFVTTRGEGVGLGLAIARRIIEFHGGTLALKTFSPEGTSFVIRLPVRGLRDNDVGSKSTPE